MFNWNCIELASVLHWICNAFALNCNWNRIEFALVLQWVCFEIGSDLHWFHCFVIEFLLDLHCICLNWAPPLSFFFRGFAWQSEFPSTGEDIQNCWHSIRSHSQSWDNMAKHWGLHFDRYCNLGSWPARRAGQASRLQSLSKSKPQCLDILSQLWLWLLIVCQQCWIFSPVLGNSDERPNA